MTGPAIVSAPRRLLSLDVLRGLTIAFMIMVNNPGGEGAWTEMRHADVEWFHRHGSRLSHISLRSGSLHRLLH